MSCLSCLSCFNHVSDDDPSSVTYLSSTPFGELCITHMVHVCYIYLHLGDF